MGLALAPIATPRAAIAVARMHAERAERVEGSLAPLAWVAAVGVRRGRARVARAPASRAGRAQHLAAVGTRAFTRRLFRIALTPRTAPRPAVAKAPVATEARDVVKSLAATTISGDRRASDGNQLQSARPLLEPPKPGMLSKGLGAPFAHVQPLLVLWGRPRVPRAETRAAGRAQSTRTIRT